MGRRFSCNLASLILAVLALGVGPSSAQEPQNPPTAPPPDTSASKTGAPQDEQSSDSDNAVKPPVYVPAQLEVRAMGSSVALPSYDTLLRWGPVYVRSMEVFQSYNQISDVTGGAQGIYNQNAFNGTALRTDILYDRPTKLGRVVIEYIPRLTVVNGHVSADFLNQTVGLHLVEPLSSRWTLGLSDTFSYYSVRNLYGDYFLDVSTITGGTVPSSFLESGGSWLNAGTQASFAYALSPTSSFSISPGFAYSRTTGLINGPEPTNGYQYSGTFAWNKRMSPNFSVQADYGYRLVQYLATRVPYNTADLGFSWQLGASTTLGGSAGTLSSGFAGGTQWTVSSSVQLAEKWGHSLLSIGYYRGVALFSELGSQGVSQVIQANYRVDLTPRWYWTAQGGYEDSITKSVTDLSGKYVSTEVGFQFSRQVSGFASYGHKTQGGGQQGLLAGTVNTVVGGVRWSARPAQ
jgi:hypothetical protein